MTRVGALAALALTTLAGAALGADVSLPGVDITLTTGDAKAPQVTAAVKILLTLTLLSVAPALLIAMTSFTRIVIVLSMLRHGLGMQETPPNSVLIALALFLSLFTMMPTFDSIHTQAYQPFVDGKLAPEGALEKGLEPLRDFMLRQTREQDLALMVEISKAEPPRTPQDVRTVQLIPAFMLSELKSAFQIGFVIFLPFLLVDLLVASALMSMGMFMVPPVVISLPLKILMFVLIDGWNLVVRSLIGSFH
jgi:flagellar biosynthesis protein FliP